MNKNERINKVKLDAYDLLHDNLRNSEYEEIDNQYVKGVLHMAQCVVHSIEEECPEIKPMEFHFDMKDMKLDDGKINAILTGCPGRSE